MDRVAPDGTDFTLSGPAGAPVVILIHGLGLNQECWQWTVPALTDGFRVLTYDLFGHGRSARPPSAPSLTLFSEQLGALMDHCGIDTAAVVGFSLGGMIARRFAQDNPERVRALGILHSPHRRTPDAQAAIVKRVEQARNEGPESTVEAALERWFTDACRRENPELMDLVRTWVTANDIAVYHTVYRVLAEGVDEITAPDPPISCPALVLTGDEDYGNGPDMTKAIAAEIKGSEVIILNGLRHMALAECPERVNRPLVAFLNRVAKVTP